MVDPVPFENFMDGRIAKRATTPRRAIHARCLYCAGTHNAVAKCDCYDSSLMNYIPGRVGKGHSRFFSRGQAADLSNPLAGRADACTTRKGQLRPIQSANGGRGASACAAIRHHCLWCMNGSSHEVELCIEPSCPLFRWRFGERPATAAKEGKRVNVKTRLSRGVLLLDELDWPGLPASRSGTTVFAETLRASTKRATCLSRDASAPNPWGQTFAGLLVCKGRCYDHP
jgi:hypothetical protein